MAGPSASLAQCLCPARKVFNFGKRKKSQEAGEYRGYGKTVTTLQKRKKKCNNGRRIGWLIIM